MAVAAVKKVLQFYEKSHNEALKVEESIVWTAGFDGWIPAVAECPTEWETPGDQKKKWYADTQENVLDLSMVSRNGNVKGFVLHWTGDEVKYEQDDKKPHSMEVPSTIRR